MKSYQSVESCLLAYIFVAAVVFVSYTDAGDRLVCNTKNETCQVQIGSLKEVIAVINFTFHYDGAENVTYIRFEDSEIGEVPRLLINKFPNVRVLDLKFCRLKRFRKPLLENAKKLLELDLSYNKLKRLEEGSFNGADTLNTLNLFRNDIVEVHDKAFQGLGKLDRLVLSSNEIRRLKPGVFKPLTNLTELDLKKNRLETVGNQLQDLNKLEIIDLSYNKIRKVGNTTLQGLNHLHIADFSFNRIDEIQEDALLFKPNLFAINFADNKLTNVNFSVPIGLSIIDLSRNKIENITLEPEVVSLENNVSSTRVSIAASFNQVKHISSSVLINKFNLSNNGLEDLSAIHKNLSVITLDISNNPLNFTTSEMDELPNDLKELIARNVSAENSESVKIIIKKLPSVAPGLIELDLSNNNLSEIDWNEFAPLEKIKWLTVYSTDVTEVESLQKVFPNLNVIRISKDNAGFNCTDVQSVYHSMDTICQSF